MKEKKIPWVTILSVAFSGIGITILEWLVDFVNSLFRIEIISKYKNEMILIITFVIIIIAIAVNVVHYFKIQKEKINSLRNELDTLKNMYEEIQADLENKERILTITQYMTHKYEELDEYYKKVASAIRVNSTIGDSMIMHYIDKLKNIISDNCSVSGSNINVTLFQKSPGKKDWYSIHLSNYHTEGTIKELEWGKRSFVANVFKEKRIKYISDIDNRKACEHFLEKPERSFSTIMGIPYVVDDESVVTVIITMQEAGALDGVFSECMPLVERYVQSIGLLVMLQNNMEVE
ncbi:MAG: hypothetical protein J6J79_06750 [Lachnospiraceae bacterium]|nr:hypothetical protein [Lachnospiraceae bacterium]